MDYKKTGAEIRKLRKARKITQKQLGEAIMRSESSIAKYEQGLVEIPPSVLMDIAEYLGVDGIDLIGVANVSPRPSTFSAAFKWLESLGYKVVVHEEEEFRSIVLRDVEKFQDYLVTDDILQSLVDNIASFSRFKIQEVIKECSTEKQK